MLLGFMDSSICVFRRFFLGRKTLQVTFCCSSVFVRDEVAGDGLIGDEGNYRRKSTLLIMEELMATRHGDHCSLNILLHA
jgi:hypothetical protein